MHFPSTVSAIAGLEQSLHAVFSTELDLKLWKCDYRETICVYLCAICLFLGLWIEKQITRSRRRWTDDGTNRSVSTTTLLKYADVLK